MKSNKANRHKKKKFGIYLNIKQKLLLSFMVPVLFIITLGVITFKIAEAGLKNSYEELAQNSLRMSAEYIQYGLDSIEATAMQYYLNDDMEKYIADSPLLQGYEKSNFVKSIREEINAKIATEKFINTIIIIPQDGNDGIYSEKDRIDILDIQNDASIVAAYNTTGFYVKEHLYVDEQINSNTDKYAFSYVKPLATKNAYFIADVDKVTIQEILEKVSVGQGSYVGLYFPSGEELVFTEQFGENEAFSEIQDMSFVDLQVNNEIQSQEISKYIEYDGSDYYYTHLYLKNSNICISSLIPVDFMLQKANKIKEITIEIIFVVIVIAGIIGMKISFGISKTLEVIGSSIKKIEQGNFNIRTEMNRNDEFGDLSKDINSMVEHVSALICNARQMTMMVGKSSVQINSIAKVLEENTQTIYISIREIESGGMEQASNAQNCLFKMGQLSERIEEVGIAIHDVVAITYDTRDSANRGIGIMDKLYITSTKTNESMQMLSDNILGLHRRIEDVEKMVLLIDEIAEQTNLLSLNASIEAARAGEQGRGFSVVAEEIRKLAEQAGKTANKINVVINDISEETQKTISTVDVTQNVILEQNTIVRDTIKMFKDIDGTIIRMGDSLSDIDIKLGCMEEARIETQEAMGSISAITEETAAASSTVVESLQSEMDNIDTLVKTSLTLHDNTMNLQKEMTKFKI